MRDLFKFEIIEMEDHLIRHPVYDHVSKKGKDWFIGKGAKFLNLEVFGVAFNFHISFITDKILREELISAKDYSVQETKEARVAARLRDILVRWCYTDRFWNLLKDAGALPSEENSQRQLKITVEETLRKLHQEIE